MYYVYILCDEPSGKLYIGGTNDIARRWNEHVQGFRSVYAHRRQIFWLVHVEIFGDVRQSLAREAELKQWGRDKKLALIQKHNPKWRVYRV